MSLSTAIPTSSNPISSMFDFIPTADNNISDSIFFSPSLSFTVAITVLVFFLTATTSEEVKILIPFFLNDFCNSLEI